MYALRQVYEVIQAQIEVPPELLNCKTEVTFMLLEPKAPPETIPQTMPEPMSAQAALQALMGSWQGDVLQREPQGQHETRRAFD